MSKKKKIVLGTCFSGIGAIEQAILRLGIDHEIAFACDNGGRTIECDYNIELQNIRKLENSLSKKKYVDDLYSKNTKKKNFVKESYLANYNISEDQFFEDIKLLDGADFENKIDLFVGGSPCQSFSIAGSRGGLEDTRGTLFYDYVRLIKEIKPKIFIYENVHGVLSHDNKRTWNTMCNVFDELGYHYKWEILNAKDYGIPQSRRRLFVVGFLDPKEHLRFEFPTSTPLDFSMQDFLEDKTTQGSLLSVNGKLKIIDNKPGIVEEKYYLSPKLLKYCLSPGTKNFMHQNAKIDLPIARALLSSMGNSHRSSVNNYVTTNDRVRALTVREVHRLMGFDDNYKIIVSKAQAYKQAGNSIVVDVLISILLNIYKNGTKKNQEDKI
jgi:DNA (cytosine-5)-methyltransferase 1